MSLPEQYAWQQQPNESIKAFQAFVTYRNLEPNERSLQRVASECTKSSSLIRRWSSKFDWIERAALWDDYQEMKRLEARIEAKQRMDEEHLQWIHAAKVKAAKALQEADPKELAKNFSQLMIWQTELIKLERLIRGEPESIEERREKLEIHTSSEEELRAYIPVFQELIDEGAITLDAVGIQSSIESGEDTEGDDEPIEFEE